MGCAGGYGCPGDGAGDGTRGGAGGRSGAGPPAGRRRPGWTRCSTAGVRGPVGGAVRRGLPGDLDRLEGAARGLELAARPVASGQPGAAGPAPLGAVAADLGLRPGAHPEGLAALLLRGRAGEDPALHRRGAARHALDPFRPVGRRPLVCPRPGAIDPSGFTSRHGRRYLLFKTQGIPSTIRRLPLTRDGRHRARHAQGRVLLRSRHIVENPVLVRHQAAPGAVHLRGLLRHLRLPHDLAPIAQPRGTGAGPSRTRCCGGATPGSAAPAAPTSSPPARKHPVVFFHGWTCGRPPTCPHRFLLGRRAPAGPRVMYAAHLRWRHGKPRVHGFVRRH